MSSVETSPVKRLFLRGSGSGEGAHGSSSIRERQFSPRFIPQGDGGGSSALIGAGLRQAEIEDLSMLRLQPDIAKVENLAGVSILRCVCLNTRG